MKYSQFIGMAAAILLVVACFLPWAYYGDINKDFTGFFSEQNVYGKPGKAFTAMAAVALIFFAIPKIWAKRWNLLINALIVAFAIRCYIVFSGCYTGLCPEKKIGLWLLLGSSIIMLLMAVFPDTKLPVEKKETSIPKGS